MVDDLVSAKRHQNSGLTEQCSTEQGTKRRKFGRDGTWWTKGCVSSWLWVLSWTSVVLCSGVVRVWFVLVCTIRVAVFLVNRKGTGILGSRTELKSHDRLSKKCGIRCLTRIVKRPNLRPKTRWHEMPKMTDCLRRFDWLKGISCTDPTRVLHAPSSRDNTSGCCARNKRTKTWKRKIELFLGLVRSTQGCTFSLALWCPLSF